MIFVLIRIFPVLISLLHFVLFRTIFYVNDFWYWPVILLLILDILYFLFIFYKKRDGIIFIFLFHSLVFLLAGLVYILILGSDIVINSFLIQAADQFSNKQIIGGEQFTVSIMGGNNPVPLVEDLDNGSYKVQWTPAWPGLYEIHIGYSGFHIAGSPFQVNVPQ